MSGMEIPLILGGVSAGATAFGTMKSVEAQEAAKDQLGLKREADIMASQESSRAYEFEARQYERQGKAIKVAAAQDETNRFRNLQSSLETIETIRAGRGLDPDSPTGRAIREGVLETASRDITTSKANSRLQIENATMASELAKRKSQFALLQGYYGAQSNDAAMRAADAGIDATIVGGIGKVADIGMSFYKQSRTYR